MNNRYIQFFKTRSKTLSIPEKLNDPFGIDIPVICHNAVNEVQEYILLNQENWGHNFGFDQNSDESTKGKMFGVLIVQNLNAELGYITTYSGKLNDDKESSIFVPSQFDLTKNDGFLTQGMIELSQLSKKIKVLEDLSDLSNKEEIKQIKKQRKEQSVELQKKLFEQYHFLNKSGVSKSLNAIFKEFNNLIPPAAAGECAAPKLIQYAYKNKLKPIAIAEFWWGRSNKSKDRIHKNFYPACRDKCRPILSYMLNLKDN